MTKYKRNNLINEIRKYDMHSCRKLIHSVVYAHYIHFLRNTGSAAATFIISNMIFSQQHTALQHRIEEAAGMIRKRRMMTHLEILDECEKRAQEAQETPKKKQKIKNRVRFSETTADILGQRERKEIRHTWYRKKDLDRFRSEGRKTVVDFSRTRGQITLLQPEEYCMRGFEHYASAYVMTLHKDKRRSHSRLILNQQELQRQSLNSHDPNSLKIISMMSSRPAREFYLRLGALDASTSLQNNVI
jgi:hypothetical protein